MQRLIKLLVIGSILIPQLVFAQYEVKKDYGTSEITKLGTTAANFLKLDVGARAMALGGSFLANASDGTAMYYNPAGIVDLRRPTITYHNIDLYADMRHQYIGLVLPVGEIWSLGFYSNTVNFGVIERTTITDQTASNGQFVYSSSAAYGITVARRLTDRVLMGLTTKFIIEKLWNDSAIGAAFDVGVIYEPGVGGLKIGLAIKHLGPEMRMDRGPQSMFYKVQDINYPALRQLPARLITDKNPLPITFAGGVSFDLVGPASILMQNDMHRLSVMGDLNDAFDTRLRSIVGLEYEWNNLISLRGGTRQNYDLFQYSVGGGVKVPVRNSELLLDYAYTDYGDLEGVFVFSLEVRF